MTVYAGVMSGTSLDGLDVAVVRFDGADERPEAFETLAFRTTPYESAFRDRLIGLIAGGSMAEACLLDFELGERIGDAVCTAIESAGLTPSDVRAIGSHGQTVWHVPPERGVRGATLQLGNASVVAERAGIDVVSDLRSRDMAAGGQGAPLTAYTDRVLFSADRPRLIQNIGGFANTTFLPARGDSRSPVAFDSGPGMALIDGAVRRLVPDATFDPDGRLAAGGTVDPAALEEWLADPYFSEGPPKSTGREYFSESRLEDWLAAHPDLTVEDTLATLTELTARSVADGYAVLPPAEACYVAGGGAQNRTLVARLAALATPVRVDDLSALGVDPEAREAIAFALLARQHVLGVPANAPWATGATAPRVLGTLTPA